LGNNSNSLSNATRVDISKQRARSVKKEQTLYTAFQEEMNIVSKRCLYFKTMPLSSGPEGKRDQEEDKPDNST